ncbi:hypothetical protein C672_1228 [[Clostridium] bifermentans ATCC 638]|uniref:GIY-YIG domain-containing protein n=1 Tax=Paraclostridium bifermentans ATCC 638 = DSM 14991 TaxID=1233171 RepID=T4VND3_PARBF|nr:hypothetical protein [Paraclostridium bifermentans]EQK42286.1 hypothetical protein C672_1228 [[Clostridium] bifermentans ATCC 638] [Paraclostridium bifermentans ATCC 638 = DSM 14991]RIZ59821.1 hypothetical protein CHH45_02565 [Paraclostridium bifermentans]UAG19140.1 hypothetical protein KXZ80_05360 [Paraclostridium bifermentans]
MIKKKFHYEKKLNTKNDRKLLLTLKDKKSPNYIGKGVNVIYVYSLIETHIPYPNKIGKVLYIGEACKKANPTGLRFSQHILGKSNEGRSRNVNYTVHKYYWNGAKIAIDIFDIGDVSKEHRKDIERNLINSHIKIYGAPPIAQGTSGVLVEEIRNIDESEANEYLF